MHALLCRTARLNPEVSTRSSTPAGSRRHSWGRLQQHDRLLAQMHEAGCTKLKVNVFAGAWLWVESGVLLPHSSPRGAHLKSGLPCPGWCVIAEACKDCQQ